MIYITGDLHGDITRFSAADMRRLKKGDTLIVCGDFGFIWSSDKKDKKEQKILKKLGNMPYAVYFVDGRHENYDRLAEYPVTEFHGGRAQVIEGSLVHLLRGQIYDFDGYTFFTFGGGESTDLDIRSDANTWWEAEMPTADEMKAGLENLAAHGNKVDYIITHEPSVRACGYLGGKGMIKVNGLNIYFNQLEEAVTFKRWFFGCLHMDKVMSSRHMALFRTVAPVIQEHGRRS